MKATGSDVEAQFWRLPAVLSVQVLNQVVERALIVRDLRADSDE